VGAGKVDLLGLPIDRNGLVIPSDLDTALIHRQPFLTTFVNPHAYHIAKGSTNYLDLLRTFDRVCCDGIGVVIAARLCLRLRVPRQAFDTTSVALPVLEWARTNKKLVFLVGGKDGLAEQAAERLSHCVAGLQIAGTFSGFGDEPKKALQNISAVPSSLVICGMGAPLQEQFLVSLKDVGWHGIGFTCGGFLDQLVERVDYYPAWINQLNLRFLYRLYKEPSRLGRRYLVEYQEFLKRLTRELLSW